MGAGAAWGAGARAGATVPECEGVGGPLGDRPLPGKGHHNRVTALENGESALEDSRLVLENELLGPREKLREVLRALTRRTLQALDHEVCYRLGLMKTKRTG